MIALGFPDELYEKVFNDPRASVNPDPYKVMTPLSYDMSLCKDIGLSLDYFHSLPRLEQRAWRLWFILENEKQKRAEEEAKKKAAMEAANKQPQQTVKHAAPRRLRG